MSNDLFKGFDSGFGNSNNSNAFSTSSSFVELSTRFKAIPNSEKIKREMIQLETLLQKEKALGEAISKHFKDSKASKNKDYKNGISDLSRDVAILGSSIAKTMSTIVLFERGVGEDRRTKDIANNIHYRMKNAGSAYQEKLHLPSAYFTRKLRQFRETMLSISVDIQELEQFLQSSLQSQGMSNPDTLKDTLRRHHDGLVNVTAKVSSLSEKLKELRQRYKDYRAKYGDTKDPFEVKKPKPIPVYRLPSSSAGNSQQQNNSSSSNNNNGFGFSNGNSSSSSGLGFGNDSNGNSGFGFGNSNSGSSGFGFDSSNSNSNSNSSSGGFSFGNDNSGGFGGFGSSSGSGGGLDWNSDFGNKKKK
mmetsp:Transcript_2684/g.3701  ORF Transcript_2684/g.3701 Transcript_2684/m.3701 type:complete len:360 (-) Transcript_2684:128-1207(-)